MDIPKSVKERLMLDHLRLISSIMSDGIIIPSKTIRANASSAAIYLPKKYIGHTFKIILLPETEADKALFKTNSALNEKNAKITQMEKRIKSLITRLETFKTKKIEGEIEETEVTSEPEDSY